MTAFTKSTRRLGRPGRTYYGLPTQFTIGTQPIVAETETVTLSSVGNRKRNGTYVTGSGFYLKKTRFSNGSTPVDVNNGLTGSGFARYIGDVYISFFPENLVPALPAFDLKGYGAAAHANARGRLDAPSFSGTAELYELKDLLAPLKAASKMFAVKLAPKVVKRVSRHPPSDGRKNIPDALRDVGDDWLTYWFGFVPLVNSVQSFTEAYQKRSSRMQQLTRDAGRVVRRGGMLANVSSTSPVVPFSNSPLSASYMRKHEGFSSTVASRRIWYSGAFSYWLPPVRDPVKFNRIMMQRILGFRITPLQLYNAMPWSWLLDYFTDIGVFLKATDAGVSDRFVASYCYVMATTEYTTMAYNNVEFRVGGKATLKAYRSVVEKQRVVGSPFGIQQSDANLTPFQLSILGALGLSRIPK